MVLVYGSDETCVHAIEISAGLRLFASRKNQPGPSVHLYSAHVSRAVVGVEELPGNCHAFPCYGG